MGALALTEPQAGSDAGSIKTRARREGRDFILSGEKRFITNGGVADYLFLLAVTDPSKTCSFRHQRVRDSKEFKGP
ncbi:MAG TPA: acyl-CoA dehydrogenase family protein [Candidatus Bathyarchaeia archaeon]|nr:acyl-CoA dehydrogenase family protein [Candidatus Bathyarchaeia archaeon]